jgi:large subunit ribosomal protein L23
MRDPFHIIKTIRLTEKGTVLAEKYNRYIFKVDTKATKQEIKHAVQRLFNKTVLRVNTMQVAGKAKKSRRGQPGRTAHWKKAIVTLKEGEKISLA